MKNGVLFALVVAILLGILALQFLGTRHTTGIVATPAATTTATIAPVAPATNPPPATSIEPPAPTATTQELQTITVIRSISPAPPAVEAPALPPLTVLDNARVVIHNYHDRFGENPVGNNAEITTALLGQNLKQVNFITEESGLRVNDQGELLDAYGTPFFFHQVSSKELEIRSAGEDRKLWTFDDQVTR